MTNAQSFRDELSAHFLPATSVTNTPIARLDGGPVTSRNSMRLDFSERRFSYPLIAVAVVLPLLYKVYWPAGNGIDVAGYQIGRDFINLWAGPQLAYSGKLWTLFDIQAYWDEVGRLFGQALPLHSWCYPLFTLTLFWPLAQLPYFWALAIWTISTFAAFAAVAVAQVAPGRRRVALVILMLAPASFMNVLGGQNGFLSAALLMGGMLALDRRPVMAGVLFGLLTFKPHLGLVLPFVLIALGAWRTIATAVATAVALVAVSVLQFGIEPWHKYMTVTTGLQVAWLTSFDGFFTYMMISVATAMRTLGFSLHAALAVQAAVAAVVLPVAVVAIARTDDACRRIFVLTTATLLVTPYAFNYDMTALSVAIVWTLVGRLEWRPAWSTVYLLGWIAPLATIFMSNVGIPMTPFIVAALFVLAVREALDGQPLLPLWVRNSIEMVRRSTALPLAR